MNYSIFHDASQQLKFDDFDSLLVHHVVMVLLVSLLFDLDEKETMMVMTCEL
jgi:hypothetical protein